MASPGTVAGMPAVRAARRSSGAASGFMAVRVQPVCSGAKVFGVLVMVVTPRGYGVERCVVRRAGSAASGLGTSLLS